MKKTLNIKLPLKIGELLSDNVMLNSNDITHLLEVRHQVKHTQELDTPTAQWSFKIDTNLHRTLKFEALEQGINLNEYTGRIITTIMN